MPRTPRVRIGCSGWQYKHWAGDFYPAGVPQRLWLEHYARHFDTVEVNNSFYRLPSEGVFAAWRERTPRAFLFAVKASRFLTHMKKLRDPDEPIARLFARAHELGPKLGPVLYQLPRQLPKDVERLSRFLDRLPAGVRHTIEFREPGWYGDEVIELLRRHKVALCVHDMPGSAAPRLVTAPFVYVRFHGATGRYDGSYPTEILEDWAAWLKETRSDVYAYFNNDIGGHAPRNAATLRDLFTSHDSHESHATYEP